MIKHIRIKFYFSFHT